MKITRQFKTDRDGKRKVVVELSPGEKLVSVRENAHYRLGQPMDDVVSGRILSDMVVVHWCSIGQKWES